MMNAQIKSLRDALEDIADAGAEAWGANRPCVAAAFAALAEIDKEQEPKPDAWGNFELCLLFTAQQYTDYYNKFPELKPLYLAAPNAADQIAFQRYEFMRTLNPQQFKELWMRNLRGEMPFDELVDAAIVDRREAF